MNFNQKRSQQPRCKQRGIKLATLQSRGVVDPRGIRQMDAVASAWLIARGNQGHRGEKAMFGRKQQRNMEDLTASLSELKSESELRHRAQEEQMAALDALRQELAACREQIMRSGQDTERQLKRHSEAVEDMLEERQTLDTALEGYEQRLKEDREREEKLLKLLCRYQEEFCLMEDKLHHVEQQYASDWLEQMAVFRKSLVNELYQCAMEETGKPGETVDYRLHEILDTADAEDMALDGTVAYCYRRGCVYRGKVIAKAQVKVYRRKTEG